VAEVVNAFFETPDGDKAVSLDQGSECCVRIDVKFHGDSQNPMFAVALRNELGHISFATSTQLDDGPTGHFPAGATATIRLRFANWLSPGRYRLTASVTRDGGGADAYDMRTDISSVIVHSTQSGGGAVDFPHKFEIQRS
jgi:hypothetical protein